MKTLALVVLALLAAGCAAPRPIGKLPRPQDFSKSKYELQTQFPELARFDPGVVKYTSQPGRGEDLLAKWGEPQDWDISGWDVIPLIGALRPRTYWNWTFADKAVRACVAHHWYRGYVPEVRWIRIDVNNEKP